MKKDRAMLIKKCTKLIKIQIIENFESWSSFVAEKQMQIIYFEFVLHYSDLCEL